jgi:glycosyltransferase involved in cell wall biosynthesis
VSLAIESGVDNLIQGFAAMPERSARLWIFGRGTLATHVADAAKADDRIEYFGFVSDDEMARRLSQSSVLVVPRPVIERVSRFVFPSKLMEYVMASRPVAATEAAGIPHEYFEHLFSLGSGTSGDITAGLQGILATSPEERMRRAIAAREFVCRSKNYILQGGRILSFLREVANGTASGARDDRHAGQEKTFDMSHPPTR